MLATIDEFAKKKEWMMNVGDEKGEILDRAVQVGTPTRTSTSLTLHQTAVGQATEGDAGVWRLLWILGGAHRQTAT